jgi:hypothetical protein
VANGQLLGIPPSLNQSSAMAVINGHLNGWSGSEHGSSEAFTNVPVTKEELMKFLLLLSEKVRSGATISLSITSIQWEARETKMDGTVLFHDFIAR